MSTQERYHAQPETYANLIRYFLPELMTAFCVYFVLRAVDGAFIARLNSPLLYGIQGGMSTIVHFITKVAQGVSIATVLVCGGYNGRRAHEQTGTAAFTSLAVTACIGIVVTIGLFVAAPGVYTFFQFPSQVRAIGIRYIRIKSLSVVATFMYYGLIGFFRGVKRPDISFALFGLGSVLFCCIDYILIFGGCGIPALGLCGSAWASVVQYTVMLLGGVAYALCNKTMRGFLTRATSRFAWHDARSIIRLSFPVMLDKATLACSKMWLVKMIAPLGAVALASFNTIRYVEQFSFLPAFACAQIMTFVIGNASTPEAWRGVAKTLRRVIGLASAGCCTLLILCGLNASRIVAWFDTQLVFSEFAAYGLCVLCGFFVCDMIQLLLAGSLRGVSDVKAVMWTRLGMSLFVFVPISYAVSFVPFPSTFMRFVVTYASFYVASACMSAVYIFRLRTTLKKKMLHFSTARVAYGEHYVPRDTEAGRDITHTRQ